MRIVAQRVSAAKVSAGGEVVGEIGDGLCLLIGVAPSDSERELEWIAEKIANLRIFSDDEGKMNRSLVDISGGVLAISQFTLYADCRKGRRPSFVSAAPPEHGERIYDSFVKKMRGMDIKVETGVFGAEMSVDIVNEGPVTIILDSEDMPSR